MADAPRVAVYLAPPPADPLFAAGATWLGRDPESDAPAPQPDLPGIAEVTAEPRLYGFHATLKPPMHLAEGRQWFDVVQAARALADRIAPFDLPPLAVMDLRGFLALRETAPCPALQALADACVAELDPFRAPASEAELARRRRAGLSAEQDAMLVALGLPLRVRHLVLPHDADPAAERGREGGVPAGRARPFRAGARGAAAGGGPVPVHPARSG